ncbi:aldo/keto reductase [Georgenia sp. Z1491]|uniref:aldo/keto reductase n=1 Tax=Georgenia sp. Z1491 TaxID=3416707 RepID=UPI003CF96998
MFSFPDGTAVPAVGLGTASVDGEAGIAAIAGALDLGYRYVDTAVNYRNETEVGEALSRSSVPRAEVMVASKIPGRAHERDKAIAAVEGSLERLGLDRLDVMLVHWPNPSVGRYVEAYEALLECRERGLVDHVGTSNYTEAHLREIVAATGEAPVLNQIECHPLLPQRRMLDVHRELGILTQAWSPLGKASAPYDAEPVERAAHTHGVTAAQVILRWHLERGVMPIPKSMHAERQRANLDVGSFSLTPDEVEAVSALEVADGRLFDGDPDTHEEM